MKNNICVIDFSKDVKNFRSFLNNRNKYRNDLVEINVRCEIYFKNNLYDK